MVKIQLILCVDLENYKIIKMLQKQQFKAKCKKCETEEEFEYIGEKDSEHQCLKCGKKLENEILD